MLDNSAIYGEHGTVIQKLNVMTTNKDNMFYCFSCGITKFCEVGEYLSHHRIFKGKKVLKCSTCGLAIMNPIIKEEELSQINERYWVVAQSDNMWARKFHKSQMLSRIEYIEKITGRIDGAKVLDVGSGYGILKDVLDDKKYSIQYYAIETDKRCRDQVIKKGALSFFSNLSECREKDFDIIFCSHIVEHLIDPKSFLGQLIGFLKNNGILFIEVPNQDYLYKSDYGTHIVFFNKDSLECLLRGINADIIDIQTVGRKIQELIYNKLHLRNKLNIILQYIPKRMVKLLSFILQLTRLMSYSPIMIEKKYEFSLYGNDRQWIRCIIKRNLP